jgi:hypothetical protein
MGTIRTRAVFTVSYVTPIAGSARGIAIAAVAVIIVKEDTAFHSAPTESGSFHTSKTTGSLLTDGIGVRRYGAGLPA